MNLFSDDLNPCKGELSPLLNEALIELKEHFSLDELSVLEWTESHIAIPLEISVNLPARGAYKIDIRHIENILIIFDKEQYPFKAPLAKSDRKDFPKSELSHLYVSRIDKPASLCLVRGNIDDWFANKSIVDFVRLIENWYWKAGSGFLTEDNEQFDPVRLEGYSGINSYPYEKYFKLVAEKKGVKEGSDFSITVQSFLDVSDQGTSYKLLFPVGETDLEKSKGIIRVINEGLEKQSSKEKWLFGIIIWSESNEPISQYQVNFPDNYRELIAFAEDTGVNLSSAIDFYLRKKLDFFNGIPVIIAVKRPLNIIGYNGNIEFFHFLINAPNEKIIDYEIADNASVSFQSHREPLSTKKAREISGYKNNLGPLLVLGAGSLGSKIILHLAKCGHLNQRILDTDKFEPHNMVRHVLDEKSIGQLKSKSLVEKIQSLYDNSAETKELIGGDRNAINLLQDQKNKIVKDCKWIVDTTASSSILNALASTSGIQANICRCEIADKGKLGLLYIEGSKRNPRVDDLTILSYALSKKIPYISQWLVNEKEIKEGNQNIVNVGVGCNSETLVMGDDLISNHASAFTRVLKSEAERDHIADDGLIFLNHIEEDGLVSIHSKSVLVKPQTVFKTTNESEWEIRVKHGLTDILHEQFENCFPNETGGVFVGVVNYKTKIIYVTDIILAPADSQASPICFVRGVKNLPQQIDNFKRDSGQLLGYIGEWHTHPHGPNTLSEIDIETIEKLKIDNDTVPIPTFLMIVTPNGILPYVY